MIIIKCDATVCKHNKDGECDMKGDRFVHAYIDIEMQMTPSGFYPICQNYEEED